MALLRPLIALALVTTTLAAQPRLAPPFGDRMVLQRDLPVNVFGTAAPGELVRVLVDGEERATATADGAGRFLAVLPAMPAGGPHELTVSASGETTVRDVLVGEVWLCSGQSNMQWQMRRWAEHEQAIADSTDEQLRLCTVPLRASASALDAADLHWAPSGPETTPDFSATAYWFGRELRRHLGVPVGLVSSSWGGTPAESWTRAEVLRADPTLAPVVGYWDTIVAHHPEAMAAYERALEAWEQARDAAVAAGETPPRQPTPPPGPEHPHRPGVLWNGMIAPLVPMTLRGVIWYQGESNAARGWQYERMFPALIRDWRRAFGQGDVPFGFVQLASFDHPTYPPHYWAELRDAQLETLRTVRDTGMAVAIDLGEANDIHPGRKDEVGRRLALWARARITGDDGLAFSGPIYAHHRIAGDRVLCAFDHDVGLELADGEARGFTIAGENREFVRARARIVEGLVEVWHEDVPEPRSVRYAWADWPAHSLRNAAGLPASPFRTDDWPLESEGRTTP